MDIEKIDEHFGELILAIKDLISLSKNRVYTAINHQLLRTYWQIGELVVSKEKDVTLSTRQLILDLSKVLSRDIGRGFSRSNLFNMRLFYLNCPDVQTLSGQISWSHLCELLTIDDKVKRQFYEKKLLTQNGLLGS